MQLKKFKEKKTKKKGMIVFTICCVLSITGIVFSSSFALFETNENFNIIEGNVSGKGDLYFAYYVNDEIVSDLPPKNSGLTLSSTSNCTNGVTVSWNQEKWQAIVDFSNYQKVKNSSTKCNLYFIENSVPHQNETYLLSNAVEGQLVDDETLDHNLRYIGADPNNYVTFNNELWRIIGIMNNMKTNESDPGESRIKIVRNESIGTHLWDQKYSVTWAETNLMKLLNPGYETESVGGSLYWNRSKGLCYTSFNNTTGACDFSTTGLQDEASISMIADTIWGVNGWPSSANTVTFYEKERGNEPYSESFKEIPSSWKGKVGLVYPSDYGYSTSGSGDTMRITCLSTPLSTWSDSVYTGCKENSWIYNLSSGKAKWTMTWQGYSNYSNIIAAGGNINSVAAFSNYNIHPTLYLKSNVQIVGGDGSSLSPFQLSVD